MSANFNDTTPAAQSGYTNVKWQKDGSENVSAEVALGSSSAFGAVKVDNTTITAAAGVISAVTGAAPALVLLEQHTASSSATLSFTTCITSSYDEYMIEFVNIIPATDSTTLNMIVSTDGGSTYDTTSGHYKAYNQYFYSGGTGIDTLATTGINVTISLSNSSNYGYCGSWKLFSPLSTAVYKHFHGIGMNQQSGLGDIVRRDVIALYLSTTAINAIRFSFSSGNIASGTIRIYGVAK